MVALTVTVTDARGKHVTGLDGADFAVFEDGVPQPISFFAADSMPLDVVLILDVSGSMQLHLPAVQRGARGLIGRLRAGDRAAILHVGRTLAVAQPLTTDLDAATASIGTSASAGATALYDGLYVALKELARERRETPELRRLLVVLFSDGQDTSSRLTFEDAVEAVRRSGAVLYAVVPRVRPATRPPLRSNTELQAEHAMTVLAREAGGRVFFPEQARDIPDVYRAIAEELVSQYEIAYVPAPDAGEGRFRRISVRLASAEALTARTRSGYYAGPPLLGTSARQASGRPDP